jgi:hypothetical protein
MDVAVDADFAILTAWTEFIAPGPMRVFKVWENMPLQSPAGNLGA